VGENDSLGGILFAKSGWRIRRIKRWGYTICLPHASTLAITDSMSQILRQRFFYPTHAQIGNQRNSPLPRNPHPATNFFQRFLFPQISNSLTVALSLCGEFWGVISHFCTWWWYWGDCGTIWHSWDECVYAGIVFPAFLHVCTDNESHLQRPTNQLPTRQNPPPPPNLHNSLLRTNHPRLLLLLHLYQIPRTHDFCQ